MMGCSAPLQIQCASTVNISGKGNKDYYWASLLLHIKRLFVNRFDCYAVQDSANPLLFPTVYKPLTDSLILDSLAGKITIGIHQISSDGKVKWLCYDFDKKHILEPKKLVDSFLGYLREWYNLTGYIELSGSPESYHVWIFTAPTDFKIAYNFHNSFFEKLRSVGIATKNIEKGISKGDKSLGTMIKLPLNINRKNGVRSEFLGDLTKIMPETLPSLILDTKLHQHNHHTPESSHVCGGVVLESNLSADIETCRKIIRKNPRVLARINNFQRDRSGMDFLVTKCLAECSIPKNIIYKFLETVPHSKIHERGHPYFSITYTNVIKTLSEDTFFIHKLRSSHSEGR